jgi:hypothetical protein
MLKTTTAAIALLALANPVLSDPALAAGCATPNEAAALKTAVIQQELMVAALQCHETSAYNRFVMAYRGELQTSDATLKSFFVRRGGEHGEAGYDSFKTKAANLSALEQARNAAAFCADAHALFAAAFAHQGNLMSFVEARAGSTDIGGICTESRPVLARSDTVPSPAAAPPVKVAQKVAQARSAEINGVPAYSAPAIPYRAQAPVNDVAPPPTPAQVQKVAARDENENYAEPADTAASGAATFDAAPPDAAPARAPVVDAAPSYAAPSNAGRAYAAPSYSAPYNPGRSYAAPAAPSYADEEAPLPPRPRYYDIRQRDYYADRGYAPVDRGYAPRAYGPPPGWERDWRDYPPAPPPPRYGWYPGPYGRW